MSSIVCIAISDSDSLSTDLISDWCSSAASSRTYAIVHCYAPRLDAGAAHLCYGFRRHGSCVGAKLSSGNAPARSWFLCSCRLGFNIPRCFPTHPAVVDVITHEIAKERFILLAVLENPPLHFARHVYLEQTLSGTRDHPISAHLCPCACGYLASRCNVAHLCDGITDQVARSFEQLSFSVLNAHLVGIDLDHLGLQWSYVLAYIRIHTHTLGP